MVVVVLVAFVNLCVYVCLGVKEEIRPLSYCSLPASTDGINEKSIDQVASLFILGSQQ